MNLVPRLTFVALLLALSTACATPGHCAVAFEGDPERAAVLAVVARSFEAIAAKGPESVALWREVLLDDGSMSSVRERDGDADPRAFLERMWDPTVLVDGDIAVVWARYDFWLDGARSHGGTDVCTLLRTDAGWRIACFAWSAEPDAPPSPLGGSRRGRRPVGFCVSEPESPGAFASGSVTPKEARAHP